jgi:hypothetical protein
MAFKEGELELKNNKCYAALLGAWRATFKIQGLEVHGFLAAGGVSAVSYAVLELIPKLPVCSQAACVAASCHAMLGQCSAAGLHASRPCSAPHTLGTTHPVLPSASPAQPSLCRGGACCTAQASRAVC